MTAASALLNTSFTPNTVALIEFCMSERIGAKLIKSLVVTTVYTPLFRTGGTTKLAKDWKSPRKSMACPSTLDKKLSPALLTMDRMNTDTTFSYVPLDTVLTSKLNLMNLTLARVVSSPDLTEMVTRMVPKVAELTSGVWKSLESREKDLNKSTFEL